MKARVPLVDRGGRVLLGTERLAGLAAHGLAFVADSLAFVRSGGRTLRASAANWPTACLSAPRDHDMGASGTVTVTPVGASSTT